MVRKLQVLFQFCSQVIFNFSGFAIFKTNCHQNRLSLESHFAIDTSPVLDRHGTAPEFKQLYGEFEQFTKLAGFPEIAFGVRGRQADALLEHQLGNIILSYSALI